MRDRCLWCSYGLRTSTTGTSSAPRAPAAMLIRRGMQGVVQDMRGTFGSGGRFVAFLQERRTGWPRPPGCASRRGDGRLAAAGASYLGYTLGAVELYLDPPLEAMCLGFTAVVASGLGGFGRRRPRPGLPD
ncbi:CocE/NonD family hydrolase [Nonomuraea angiospora]|uniref:CocE/NonD family hydrolase n=1 Tax=Nonomuraea angiospora TaxID=46172 RepID=UPI0037BAF8CD